MVAKAVVMRRNLHGRRMVRQRAHVKRRILAKEKGARIAPDALLLETGFDQYE